MSNYPPGVTGNEWQIAGPLDEYETSVSVRGVEWCESAPDEWEDVTGEVTVWDRHSADFTWICRHCKGEHTKPFEEFEE